MHRAAGRVCVGVEVGCLLSCQVLTPVGASKERRVDQAGVRGKHIHPAALRTRAGAAHSMRCAWGDAAVGSGRRTGRQAPAAAAAQGCRSCPRQARRACRRLPISRAAIRLKSLAVLYCHTSLSRANAPLKAAAAGGGRQAGRRESRASAGACLQAVPCNQPGQRGRRQAVGCRPGRAGTRCRPTAACPAAPAPRPATRCARGGRLRGMHGVARSSREAQRVAMPHDSIPAAAALGQQQQQRGSAAASQMVGPTRPAAPAAAGAPAASGRGSLKRWCAQSRRRCCRRGGGSTRPVRCLPARVLPARLLNASLARAPACSLQHAPAQCGTRAHTSPGHASFSYPVLHRRYGARKVPALSASACRGTPSALNARANVSTELRGDGKECVCCEEVLCVGGACAQRRRPQSASAQEPARAPAPAREGAAAAHRSEDRSH